MKSKKIQIKRWNGKSLCVLKTHSNNQFIDSNVYINEYAEVHLPMTVKFIRWFLVGEFWKSTRQRYTCNRWENRTWASLSDQNWEIMCSECMCMWYANGILYLSHSHFSHMHTRTHVGKNLRLRHRVARYLHLMWRALILLKNKLLARMR
jgi:trehalose/maltose hydrolase-like predicted phosphorylase